LGPEISLLAPESPDIIIVYCLGLKQLSLKSNDNTLVLKIAAVFGKANITAIISDD